MKLLLEKHKDLNILIVSGEVTTANFGVLRAGIKKLFTTGKNKIILDLPESKAFTSEILREFAMMNLVAAELSGQLLLSSIDLSTRGKIDSFSKPPVIRCFATREEAIAFFYPPEVKKSETAAVAPDSTPTTAAPASPTVTPTAVDETKIQEEKKQFKTDIRNKELGDVGSLRKKISELEEQNKELMIQLTGLVVSRRDPPDLPAWKEKVEILQKQLDELLITLNGTKDAPKKQP